MRSWVVVLVALGLLATSDTALRAESLWSLKNLFSLPRSSRKSESGTRLVRKPKRTSPLEKVNESTKALLAKTREMTPTSLLPKAQSGLRNTAHAVTSSAARLGNGLVRFGRAVFHPWGPDEAPQPQTVPEFLAQPRPEF